MALFEVKAYKCEWCGKLFEHERSHHEIECRHDPKARTCVSCAYSRELKQQYNNDEPKATGVYCPRADKVFLYPCAKYCADWVKEPHLESYNKPKPKSTA